MAAGVETMTVGTLPKRRYMMGPYSLVSLLMVRWGKVPSMWRWPIIGNPRGPGGSL